MSTFDDLINQIDAFIRKFYKNQMLKGLLLFLIIFLFTFLMVTGLEYIGRFNSFVRAVLLFSFIGLNGYVLFRYFIIPLLKLFSFGERINRFQAAKIIGEFFDPIDDKLLNTLQLKNYLNNNEKNKDLIIASINQNSKQLNAFTFTSAIDYSQNKKFLKYFIPILLTIILIGIAFPNFFSEGSERLIKYNQVFERSPDFTFELQNDNLTVEQGESLEVEVLLIPQPGKSLPERVYVESDEGRFLMNKTANNKASYTFNNLSKTSNFRFVATHATSETYQINIINRTSLGHLKVDIEYPSYLEREKETIDYPGDLIVPIGSQLTWNGITNHTKNLKIIMNDTVFSFPDKKGFRFSHSALHSDDIFFILENESIKKHDTLLFHLEVIRDEYPSISVEVKQDSLIDNKLFFNGNVSDDYGLTNLIFTFEIQKSTGETIQENINVPGITGKRSPFSMTFNLDELNLSLEDQVIYFFTIYDNDGVNGPKATKSNVYQYMTPSFDELQEKRSDDKEKAKEDLMDLMRESREFQNNLNRLKMELLNSKQPSWQQQQQLKDLQKQQESLQQKIQETKNQLNKSFEDKSKLLPQDEKLLEMQKQLEEMLDALMDDELKSLLEELQELMDSQMNKDLLQKLEDSEMSAEDMERQLDRTMEMLKRMDVQERVKDLQETLEQLSNQQESLKDNLDNMSNEKSISEQEKLNQKFDELKDKISDMLDLNEELKRPFSFDELDDLMDSISDDLDNAIDNLGEGNSEGAKQKQQEASEKMQEAASQMKAQMQANAQQQSEEDYHAIRALIENLVRMSFDQENVMEEFRATDTFDPYFTTLGREQRSIIDNLSPIKDSLRALSARVPQISSFIEQELRSIEKLYRYLPEHIGEREKPQLLAKQQFAMTHINNLALFMNEALEAAQSGMMDGQPNDGEEGSPGEGSPGQGQPGKSGQGQDGDLNGLKEMIKNQLKQMKGGNQPGGAEPGGVLPMNSQGAAKMAAEQNLIRQRLQELREQLNKDGSGDGNQLNKLLEELEKQQEDLINKNWSTELIERQQEILTRLLESENALRERGWDEERKGNEGKDENFGNQIDFLEYNNQKEKQIELLRTLDPSFSRYYKDKANEYFQQVQ